jgi:hypothetical protein
MPVDREMPRALVGELLEALRTYQNAADAVDEAASFSLGLNATDVRCLDIIERAGGVPAGCLAAETADHRGHHGGTRPARAGGD